MPRGPSCWPERAGPRSPLRWPGPRPGGATTARARDTLVELLDPPWRRASLVAVWRARRARSAWARAPPHAGVTPRFAAPRWRPKHSIVIAHSEQDPAAGALAHSVPRGHSQQVGADQHDGSDHSEYRSAGPACRGRPCQRRGRRSSTPTQFLPRSAPPRRFASDGRAMPSTVRNVADTAVSTAPAQRRRHAALTATSAMAVVRRERTGHGNRSQIVTMIQMPRDA